jgi:threonine/homoserine/homoserine lactone efflux protein
MSRILLAVVGLAVLGYLGYRAMYGQKRQTLEEREASAPKQQLDNVRGAAQRIEANDKAYADDLDKKMKNAAE